MKLLLIRHGQTVVNTKGAVHAKNDDTVLDQLGVKQSKALAQYAAGEAVEVVYCSPESRAQQTAEIIAEPLNASPIVINELAERDWGDWSGMSWADIQAKLEGMDLEERYTFEPPHGESWQQMEERLRQAVKIITADEHRTVAVVSHGGAIRALMPILKLEPKETSFKYDFKNASVTSLDNNNGEWRLISENDITHLER